jgi:hypothetical protein
MRTVYLIGKVTGLPRWWVKLKFGFWQNLLWWGGYDVINPIDRVPKYATYDQAMDMCLNVLLPKANIISIIPGWNKSKGSKDEIRHVIRENQKCRNRYLILKSKRYDNSSINA